MTVDPNSPHVGAHMAAEFQKLFAQPPALVQCPPEIPPAAFLRYTLELDGEVHFHGLENDFQITAGLDPESVMADSNRFLLAIPEPDRRRFMTTLMANHATGDAWGCIFPFNGQNRLRQLQILTRPAQSPYQPEIWEAVLLDVTSAQNDASRAQTLGELATLLLNTGNHGVLVLEPIQRHLEEHSNTDTPPTFMVHYANHAARNLLGRNKAFRPGLVLQDLMANPQAPGFLNFLGGSAGDKIAATADFILDPETSQSKIRVFATPWDAYLIVSLQPMTTTGKLVEMALMGQVFGPGSELFEKDFLAALNHELRTPLNAIIGFSEMISTQSLGPNAVVQYGEFADGIRDSGWQLLAVVEDLLDLADRQIQERQSVTPHA